MLCEELLKSRINHTYCREFVERDLPKDTPPKVLMILGHGRSGKDTVAEYLNRHYGYRFGGTSSTVLCRYIYPENPDEMYQVRHTYKQQLFDFGNVIRDIDPRFIPYMSLQNNSQLLVGLRAKLDIAAALESCVSNVIWINSAVPDDPTMDYTLQWLVEACNAPGKQVPLFMMNNIKDQSGKGLRYLYSQIQELQWFLRK